MHPTWKRIAWFIGIIIIGLVGLMVADQVDFLNGRKGSPSTIGGGVIDTNTASAVKVDLNKTGIDGVKVQQKSPCKGKC